MLKSGLTFLFITLLFCTNASAGRGSSGVSFDGAIGIPSITLSNPDGSIAGYDGLSLQGRLLAPLFADDKMSVNFQGVLKYHDVENTISSSDSTEVGSHIGPGVGLSFKFGKIFFGYEYMLMNARHYYIGATGRKADFNYTASNLYLGASVPYGDLAVGISIGQATGKVPKAETGLSKDSDYAEQSIWFHISYSTGVGLGSLAKGLVKK